MLKFTVLLYLILTSGERLSSIGPWGPSHKIMFSNENVRKLSEKCAFFSENGRFSKKKASTFYWKTLEEGTRLGTCLLGLALNLLLLTPWMIYQLEDIPFWSDCFINCRMLNCILYPSLSGAHFHLSVPYLEVCPIHSVTAEFLRSSGSSKQLESQLLPSNCMHVVTAYDFSDLSFATGIESNEEAMEEVNIDDEITLDVPQENNNNTDTRSNFASCMPNCIYISLHSGYSFSCIPVGR